MTDAPEEEATLFGFAELVAVTAGPVAVVLLVWAFGLRAWWWALPLAIVLAIVAQLIAESFSEDVEPELEPPPRKRELPPQKPRRARTRRKAKVVDLATERARRTGAVKRRAMA